MVAKSLGRIIPIAIIALFISFIDRTNSTNSVAHISDEVAHDHRLPVRPVQPVIPRNPSVVSRTALIGTAAAAMRRASVPCQARPRLLTAGLRTEHGPLIPHQG